MFSQFKFNVRNILSSNLESNLFFSNNVQVTWEYADLELLHICENLRLTRIGEVGKISKLIGHTAKKKNITVLINDHITLIFFLTCQKSMCPFPWIGISYYIKTSTNNNDNNINNNKRILNHSYAWIAKILFNLSLKDHFDTSINFRVGLGCWNKANCPHMGPGLVGRASSVGIFL